VLRWVLLITTTQRRTSNIMTTLRHHDRLEIHEFDTSIILTEDKEHNKLTVCLTGPDKLPRMFVYRNGELIRYDVTISPGSSNQINIHS